MQTVMMFGDIREGFCLPHIDHDQLLLQWKSLPVFVVGKAGKAM